MRPIAALHLARGEPGPARDLLERTLAAGGLEDVAEGVLLALLVDVALADDAADDARIAVDRLSALARDQAGPYLPALAGLARGKVCVVTGTGDARSCLHDALRAFVRARLPVEAARTQLELAKALAPSTPAAAVTQAHAALASFRRLRADRDADVAAALLRTLGVASPPGWAVNVGASRSPIVSARTAGRCSARYRPGAP